MTKFEAVLCDFGGVLTDDYSEATYHLEISGKFGVAVDELMPFLKAGKFLSNLLVGTVSEEEVVRRVREEFPEAIAIDPRAINSDFFIPSQTALDAVRRLKERTGVKVAVGSNIFPSSREILRKEGLEDVFDKLYYSCELGLRKPDLDFYEYIATDLQVEPNKILFLDDVLANVTGAQDAGYNAMQVTGSSAQTIRILDSI